MDKSEYCMEKLVIESSTHTPYVHLERGRIELAGRSVPEDPKKFYDPILDWLDGYVENVAEKTQIVINLDFLNTASLKCLIDVLIKCNNLFVQQKDVQIEWYYDSDDDEMLELGNDLKAFIDIPIAFKQQTA